MFGLADGVIASIVVSAFALHFDFWVQAFDGPVAAIVECAPGLDDACPLVRAAQNHIVKIGTIASNVNLLRVGA